ncbi:MAG: class I SAM-dependent methyltransferase [Firmicutes bacterium]|nr:class I SAM-dependent methyltransferase [Bacillota bacterium]
MQSLKNIDKGKNFDFGKTSENYASYRDIYPEEFYRRIIDLGLCGKGQRVLDLGTGTGVLPRNMYKYGAKFVGADISENQIETARRLSSGMDIQYITAAAEDVDFPDASFDTVTACQCFMYFNKDTVLPKIHRLLRDGGHFCIMFMGYLPLESEIARKSEELILKYNPVWNGANYAPDKSKTENRITPDWCKGMFETEKYTAFGVNVSFTRESWNGRMKTCRGVGASLDDKDIDAWEREHMAFLNTMPERFNIPHWVTMLNLKKI